MVNKCTSQSRAVAHSPKSNSPCNRKRSTITTRNHFSRKYPLLSLFDTRQEWIPTFWKSGSKQTSIYLPRTNWPRGPTFPTETNAKTTKMRSTSAKRPPPSTKLRERTTQRWRRTRSTSGRDDAALLGNARGWRQKPVAET